MFAKIGAKYELKLPLTKFFGFLKYIIKCSILILKNLLDFVHLIIHLQLQICNFCLPSHDGLFLRNHTLIDSVDLILDH